MSEGSGSPELVLDTSVAVKFHVPEERHEEARTLQRGFEDGAVSLLAPGTVLPEVFNAFWQKHRRGELTSDEVRAGWELISELPLALYSPEDLIGRAVDISFETGVIIYDALFLALAEDAETVVITDDGKLLKAVKDTPHARLAHPLAQVVSLISDNN
ncbi:MAG: type II toxin-antitoxin system VapC family toxin [Actinobacteria bacterium]|nr:type II toxin-antitoxin system VapC family toxin [Actinomycetota bacterium]MCA1718271.1 type II toxin-antitoxin system VapC family toxin [Actinomycetota bacterium]